MKQLEDVVIGLIQHGRDRCGAGFGKYPLGVLYAVEELISLCDPAYRCNVGPATIDAALKDFRQRLAKP